LQNLHAPPDGRGTSKRCRIVASIVITLIASSFATQCSMAAGNGESISVRYRAKVLGNSGMPAEIRYETPTGTKKIDVPALPWQSGWFEFGSDATVAVIVRIPKAARWGTYSAKCSQMSREWQHRPRPLERVGLQGHCRLRSELGTQSDLRLWEESRFRGKRRSGLVDYRQ